MRKQRSSTPCLGICSTTYGDDVCRGCKRFIHEVINWNSYSNDEKEIVNSRLEEFKVTILSHRFKVTDAELLSSKLKEHAINFNDALDPITWIFDLLRAYSSIIQKGDNISHLTIAYSELYSVDHAIQRLKNIFGNVTERTNLLKLIPKFDEKKIINKSILSSNFVASLELAKNGFIEVKQNESFGNIFVKLKQL